VNSHSSLKRKYDAVLIGAGIMSSTLATLLNELEPESQILILERLDEAGLESSSPLNNAGTGHAANCELNYTPIDNFGKVDIKKAIDINESFERSLELWSSLAELGELCPNDFLKFLPHISFVKGKSNVDFLKKRFNYLNDHHFFKDMIWSSDLETLKDWMPLMFQDRYEREGCYAATSVERGTDIDFGALTKKYIERLQKEDSFQILYGLDVKNLSKTKDDLWDIKISDSEQKVNHIFSKFVFIGAGGGSLPLLQKTGIPESKFYGGFPVGGQWLICEDSKIAQSHDAKVYGKADMGSPPMSVPHLDKRWINNKQLLLFGPFAGVNMKFLKTGSQFDLFNSVNKNNLISMLQVGIQNVDLINYLISQSKLDHTARIEALRSFMPSAKENNWNLCEAGQRVQIIKKTKNGGVLKMGTEVVISSDNSLAALLGASPGASTAVSAMMNVITNCWKEKMFTNQWQEKLSKLFPSYGQSLSKDYDLMTRVRERNNSILGFIRST